ncbi:MAG: glycosyltransferase family 4 protein, partial [Chloroflexi bacterium]|nr:glycosyltransferase family 4 protein [Chloroflexota bacterium]
LTLLPLELGRPLGQQQGLRRGAAVLDNARGVASLVRLARWCRAQRVDIVHVTERPRQSLFGLLLARMAGCACLIHAHTAFYPHDATRLATLRLRQADALVGVSAFAADSYRRLVGLPSGRVFTVHNAVDTDVFAPNLAARGRQAMRERIGIANGAPLIGYVARLMRWKRQDALLEAFAEVRRTVPDAQLVLAGASADSAPDGVGDYRAYLLRRTAALGLEGTVHLPGFLSANEMPALFGALDLVAHPSTEEPFGLAIVEAMACAKPVVAIDGGGVPEIIQANRNGVLVPAEQPTAMAGAIVSLLRDPDTAHRLAEQGRARVLDQFTPSRQAAAMLDVYRRVVAVRRH